jgi:TrmH family RNA methyltransferase
VNDRESGGASGGSSPLIVTSRENATFKDLKKLARSSRERRKRGLVFLEGTRLVRMSREHVGEAETVVVMASEREREDLSGLVGSRWGRRSVILDDALFRDLSTLKSPSPVMAVVSRPKGDQGGGGDALLIEGIQDPGNLGTMFRSAAAAGVGAAFLSGTCADAWSPKCLRAGMGAHFMMEISEKADLVEKARTLGGTVVALTPGSATSLYEVDLAAPVTFAVGSEGEGLSAELRQGATVEAGIPMPGWKESLNAAAALSIGLFEMVRQRRVRGKS